jgi:multiple sugar transport system permease protein
MILFALTILLPAVMAVRFSLFKMSSFIDEPVFIGLGNFVALAGQQRFWNAFGNNMLYTGACVFFQTVIGIGVALILHNNFPGRNLVRGATIVPYIIPSVVVAITWRWMLQPQLGIMNAMLRSVGLPAVEWFSVNMAMPTMVLISTWTWMPFVALVFLAALQTVPDELYESATIDGANWRQRFTNITLPVLKPAVAIIILLRGIWMFNKFDQIWLLTGGGPLQTTETLPILTYLKTFSLNRVGEGTALVTLSLVVTLIGTMIYFRVFRLEEA